MRYRLAIFDMDGTILDTLGDLANSINYALVQNGLPARSLEEVRQFVGNGIGKLVARAVPEGSDDKICAKVLKTFNAYYKDHCASLTKPYDGILELLKTLREQGVLTAVVSNKPDYGVQALCEKYFNGLFDCAVGEREGVQRKPSPDSVNMVLEELQVERDQAVYIGDSDVDYQTSINAGMDVIMVGWGFRTEEFILECGAPFVVHTPEEVLEHMR